MANHIYEGLGYTLKAYDPCFNFNADRFCCSKNGANFRKNILTSECPTYKSNDYSRPRNYDPSDKRPLEIMLTGLIDPVPYEFTPQARWHIWCDRMPCSVDQTGVPCQGQQPYCRNPAVCDSGNRNNKCSRQ